MESSDNEEGLKAMKYRDLQKVAKKVGVKATLPTSQLVQEILKVKPSKVFKIMESGK